MALTVPNGGLREGSESPRPVEATFPQKVSAESVFHGRGRCPQMSQTEGNNFQPLSVTREQQEESMGLLLKRRSSHRRQRGSWAWWLTPVIPALRRQRQQCHEFKAHGPNTEVPTSQVYKTRLKNKPTAKAWEGRGRTPVST